MTARSLWLCSGLATASMTLVAVLFGGALVPRDDAPRLAQAGAQLAPWLIGLVVLVLIAGAAFLIIGRRRKG